jgi:uncharacterized paraquat-inducible protein A
MIIVNPQEPKYHRFKSYLRICYRCDNFFDADTKRSHYCQKCKTEIKQEKIDKSLLARGIIRKTKEVIINEFNRID